MVHQLINELLGLDMEPKTQSHFDRRARCPCAEEFDLLVGSWWRDGDI